MKSYKILYLSCAIFLIFSPFVLVFELGYYDTKRVLQLGLFVVFGFTSLLSLYQPQRQTILLTQPKLKTRFVYSAFAVLVLAGLFSVLLSDNSEIALLEYAFFLLLIIGLFIALPVNKRMHYYLGKIIFITAFLYSSLYLIIFFGNYISSFYDQLIPLWPGRLSYSIIVDDITLEGKEVLYFVHRRFFNHTQTWTLPIILGLFIFYLKKQPNNWVLQSSFYVLISFWWMLIFASGARGSLLSLIIALAIITLYFGKTVYQFIKHTLGTLVLGTIFYLLMFRSFATDQTPLIRTSDSGRLQMWDRAIELWMQEPFFGIGPLHYAKIIDSAPYFSHPHNFYLQFLTEWGIIAFLALSLLLIFAGLFVIKNYSQIYRKGQNQRIYITFVWSITAALIHASISGVMHTPISQIWFILIGVWLLGYIRYQKNFYTGNIWSSYSIKVIFILLLGIVLFLTVGDIYNLENGYSEYIQKYSGSSFYSRFWEQGLFE